MNIHGDVEFLLRRKDLPRHSAGWSSVWSVCVETVARFQSSVQRDLYSERNSLCFTRLEGRWLKTPTSSPEPLPHDADPACSGTEMSSVCA